MYKLVSQKNRILYKKARRVEDFEGSKIRRLVSEMKEIMKRENGIGLAAPQIGKSLRAFVVDTEFIRKSEEHKNMSRTKRVIRKLFKKRLRETFINPRIISIQKEKFLMEEGCLSIARVFGIVPRAKQIIVAAQDEYGKRFKVNATNLYAHVLQHEIDHLNGVLFVEKAMEGSLHKLKVKK